MYVCRTLKHEEAAQLQKCQQPDKYIETAQHAIIAPEAGGTGAHVVATMMHRTRHVFTCTSRLVGVELARSPLSSNLAATAPPLPPPAEAPPKEAAVAPGPLPLSLRSALPACRTSRARDKYIETPINHSLHGHMPSFRLGSLSVALAKDV